MYSEVAIAGGHTEFGVMSVYGTELLLAVALIVGSLFNRKRFAIDRKRQLPIRLVALLSIVVVLGAVFADRSLFSLAMATHFLFACALFLALLFDRVSVKHILFAFVFSLIIPLALGVSQVLGGFSPANSWLGLAFRDAAQLGDAVFTVDGERVLRAYGSFSHPNVFGGFLGVGLFAWWGAMATVRQEWSKRKRLAVTAVGTALLVAGLLFTGSRSAFLGVLVGLVLVFVVKSIPSMNVARPVSAVLATLAVLGSLFGSFFFTDLASSIRGGGVNEERSLIERISLYEDFVPFMASTNMIVGHGIGSYVLSISDNQPGKNAFDYQPIHNVFLLILAEIGVLGLITALCVVASVVQINFSRFPRHDALYAFGMGNVIFMVCFFDHYLWSSWSGLALIAFVLAMMVRMGENSA